MLESSIKKSNIGKGDFSMAPHKQVYLVTGHANMRKSIDGLSLIVNDVLKMDPLSEA